MPTPKPPPLLDNLPVNLKPPDWLSHRQKYLWRTTIANVPVGLLSRMDAGMLTTWVIACDTHREACEKSRGLGLIVKSPNKGVPMQNPYLAIINRQAEIMIRAAGDLGFTPIARSRLARLEESGGPKTLSDDPLGKKEQAQLDAVTAQTGTDWAELLPGTVQ
jgi:P27 family predicted phage terminase small subunit